MEDLKQIAINAWVDACVDEMKTAVVMSDYCRKEEDGVYSVRSGNPLWGSYWTIRKIGFVLNYKESRKLEKAMDDFLNAYCTALDYTDLSDDEENDNV